MTTSYRQHCWWVTVPLAALAVAYLTFVWMPGRKHLQALQRQLETQREFLAGVSGLQTSLTTTQTELERAESVAKHWESQAPHQKDIPALYGKINALAKDAGLAVGKFDPQPLVLHEKIQEMPLKVACSGKFAQIFEFLRGVEGLPVTIWITSLKIERAGQDAKDVKCDMDLTVFSDNP